MDPISPRPAIAVVGLGCRFPGARNTEEFWELLRDNDDAITEIPKDRFDARAHYSPTPGTPGKTSSLHGGFLADLYGFDAGFFQTAPREARAVDPQQRLLLHVAWEALEHAGIRPSTLAGSDTGVFVGQATSEYSETSDALAADVRALAGSKLRAVTAGRLSYALDLRGPSLVLDSACSSSLLAVHAACQSLLTGESSLALAAGVNVLLSVGDSVAYSQGLMLSPDGRCKFGSAAADGFVRSEGVGVVVLKRLDDALRDNDQVLAQLRGSAVTNDGRGSGLLLQPAVSGQVNMLRQACRSAGVDPRDLAYVEAHGTGTTVGDSVELRALAEALRPDGPTERPLLVGSVKSNIGHSEAAAGIAGLIKVVLALQHRTVPASLHVAAPNPLISTADLPLRIVTRNTPLLTRDGSPAVVGVSSFGISGTNAHVVLGQHVAEQVDSAPPQEPSDHPHLLVLSARSRRSLLGLAARYAEFLGPSGAGSTLALREICQTAATGRDAHPYRLWAVGGTHQELRDVLLTLSRGEPSDNGGTGEAVLGTRSAVFVFSGQGSQWQGMGRELLRSSPAFRTALEECDQAIEAELGWSVIDLLTDTERGEPRTVDVVQPALWAMHVSLAALWREMGVEPDLTVGHSVGEVAAACVSGGLSVRDAARVVCRRSTLMQRTGGQGAMLSVELSADEAHALISSHGDDVCVAVENAPHATVLAGRAETLRRIAAELTEREIFCRLVRVNVASHSPEMDALREDLLEALTGLRPTVPQSGMFSTTRCAPILGADLDAHYWMENLRGRVRFRETIETLSKDGDHVFVEVSPHPVLVSAIDDVQEAVGQQSTAVPTGFKERAERNSATRALGRAFTLGVAVDWNRRYGARTSPPVPLPLYAWDSEVFRHEPTTAAPVPATTEHVREVDLRELGLPVLADALEVRGMTPVPATTFFEAVTELGQKFPGPGTIQLEDVQLTDELLLADEALDARLRVTLDAGRSGGLHRVTVDAVGLTDSPEPVRCLTAGLRHDTSTGRSERRRWNDLDLSLTRCTEYVPAEEFYRRAEARGYRVEDPLRSVVQLWRRDGEVVARLALPEIAASAAAEAALLPLLATWPHSAAPSDTTCGYVATAFERMWKTGPLLGEFWHVSRFSPDPTARDVARCDVRLVSSDGWLLAEYTGIRMRKVGSASAGPPPSVELMPSGNPPPTPRPVALTNAPTGVATWPTHDVAAEARTGMTIVLEHAASVLGTAAGRINTQLALRDHGLDSMMAGQLRRELRRATGTDVTMQRLLGGESIDALVRSLTNKG